MNRRQFVKRAGSGALIAVSGVAAGQGDTQEKADPAGAQQQALGYVLDAKDVDKAKFPRFEASQNCANCVLYQGAAEEEWAPCTLFLSQLVPAEGWCSAWVEKPA